MNDDTERLDFMIYNPDLRIEQWRDLTWEVGNARTGETLAAGHSNPRSAIDEAREAVGEQAAEKGGVA